MKGKPVIVAAVVAINAGGLASISAECRVDECTMDGFRLTLTAEAAACVQEGGVCTCHVSDRTTARSGALEGTACAVQRDNGHAHRQRALQG